MAVREIPRGRHDTGNADEVRRGSDGHWANVQRGAAEGDSLARATYALARSCGDTGIAAARKTGHTARGPHPVANDGRGPRASCKRDLRAHENRSLVHSATRRDQADEPPGRERDRGNGFPRFAA